MALTLEEILIAARAGRRIDPPYRKDAITILFDRDPKSVDAQAIQVLLNRASSEYGVEFELIGGGAGCLRIIFLGGPKEALDQLLTSDEFLKEAAELGVTFIWSGEPGMHIPVERSLDESVPSRADFAILTPLIEEFRPLRTALRSVAGSSERRIQNPDNVMTYYKYDIVSEPGIVYRVVATFMPKMGNDSAAITTFHVLNDWRPRHVLLGGIAGGVDASDTALGDVVIADEVFRYDRRRKERASGTSWAPSAYVTDRMLLNRAQAYLLEDECIGEWAEECRSSFDGVCDPPKAVVGNIACGDAVIDSAKFKGDLTSLNRTLCAIEMEGGGFLEAIINQAAVTRALIVRGISDLAAGKSTSDSQNLDWRGYAATNAARFIVGFIQQYGINADAPDTLVCKKAVIRQGQVGKRPEFRA